MADCNRVTCILRGPDQIRRCPRFASAAWAPGIDVGKPGYPTLNALFALGGNPRFSGSWDFANDQRLSTNDALCQQLSGTSHQLFYSFGNTIPLCDWYFPFRSA